MHILEDALAVQTKCPCAREPMPRIEAERLIDLLLDVAWPNGFSYRIEPLITTEIASA